MHVVIELEETETKGRFVYRADGYPEAELTFSKAGTGLIIVDHTGVPDELRGKDVGLKLVQRVVDYARSNQLKVLPLCPFTASQFRRHPEWADLLQ